MNKIDIVRFFNVGFFLQTLIQTGEDAKHESQIEGDEKTWVVESLERIEARLQQIDMTHSAVLVHEILLSVKGGNSKWKEVGTSLGCTLTVCRSEMSSIFAGYIPAERARFWGQEKPFGELVYTNFESARADITAAGNCYAIEQWDACIFHMMRVAEKGLRILARERGIRKLRNAPIEWADWQTIVSALEDAAKKIKDKWSKGAKKDKALEFYRGAIGEIYAFKDAYRNYVMHARSDNDLHKAATAYHRVGEFMQRLAAYLSENQAGAIKWANK